MHERNAFRGVVQHCVCSVDGIRANHWTPRIEKLRATTFSGIFDLFVRLTTFISSAARLLVSQIQFHVSPPLGSARLTFNFPSDCCPSQASCDRTLLVDFQLIWNRSRHLHSLPSFLATSDGTTTDCRRPAFVACPLYFSESAATNRLLLLDSRISYLPEPSGVMPLPYAYIDILRPYSCWTWTRCIHFSRNKSMAFDTTRCLHDFHLRIFLYSSKISLVLKSATLGSNIRRDTGSSYAWLSSLFISWSSRNLLSILGRSYGRYQGQDICAGRTQRMSEMIKATSGLDITYHICARDA